MAMTKEQILKSIERAELALGRTDREGAKAVLKKQIDQMKSDLAALEKETVKKEEKIEEKEQAAKEDFDADIAKFEALLKRNPGAKIREVFEKKLKEAKRKKAEMEAEAKADKAEAKQELKEVKEAVKDIEKAVATGSTEPIKKPKIEEKKREDKSKKRIKTMQQTITSLSTLVDKVKELKDKYVTTPSGRVNVDLKRDAGRPAKPFGYRFTGKGKNAYRVPTPAEIKLGKKRGTIDYEGRPNRSDVYPKGYKGNVREKLATGGTLMAKMAKGGELKGESVWIVDMDGVIEVLQESTYRNAVKQYKKSDHWKQTVDEASRKVFVNEDGGKVTFRKKNIYADGGKMTTGPGAGFWKNPAENDKFWDDVKKQGKKKKEKFDYDEEALTGERAGERRAEMGYADGGGIDPISKKDVLDVAKSLKKNLTDEEVKEVIEMYPSEEENDPGANWREIVENCIYQLKSVRMRELREGKMAKGGKAGVKTYKLVPMVSTGVGTLITPDYKSTIKFTGTEDEALAKAKELVNSNPKFVRVETKLEYKTKTVTVGASERGVMAKGGKLVGKQANLDMNKNGRLDKEDFQILRGKKKKMAKGGKTMRKNSPHRFCWTKDAVKDGIIKPADINKTPSRYQRKNYAAYIMEK